MPEEAEIRRIANELYQRVNWPWAIELAPDIRMAWSPELQFGGHDWRGYNEAMLVFILALGSPTFPAADHTWVAWTSNYYRHWGTLEGQTHLTFGPMFGHQYTHIWIDLRGIKDEFMWPLDMDYFENSRRAVLAQRAYAIRNRMDWTWLRPQHLGTRRPRTDPAITNCDYLGQKRKFHSYAARGIGLNYVVDDGTIAPTAAIGSLPFAPEVVIPAAQPCTSNTAATSTASTASSMPSTRASTTTCRCGTAAACAVSAGWTPSTSASTRAPSSR